MSASASASLAGLLLLAACDRGAHLNATAAAGADAGFLAPPLVLTAERTATGALRLAGRAPADAVVRLVAPDGRALGAAADGEGRWSAELPAVEAPQLFALSAEVGGRTLRAEGALAQTPASARAPALLARAGAPALPLGAAQAPGPQIVAVDFDKGGGLAVAGRAAPDSRLRLQVDGAAMGTGQADAAGRFGLLDVGAQSRVGPHRVRVEAANGPYDTLDLATDVPEPLTSPFRAARLAAGWRVDWSPPGGGVQSLFLPDASTPPPSQGPVR